MIYIVVVGLLFSDGNMKFIKRIQTFEGGSVGRAINTVSKLAFINGLVS